jgi:3-methylcrotonyl-CoA carboxylase alpha subunit
VFTKILIANRGEIACRVIATAKRMGIATVAVYSDADARAKHVLLADEAYRLGPAPARESYLKGADIIALARACGAQAIHPGYGFLSENEDFARACAKAGLVFIGPPADAIAAMGGKSAAKRLMEEAKVPLVPGYHGERQEPEFLAAQADAIGYPILIKASAGGGGKGMRIVQEASEFTAALASCQREAINAFGDDKVLIERYLTKPRHIEVQVFGDSHGQCVYLFERDCSVQRRHQKVAEEAPAPGMTQERRRAMGEAAVAAAKAVQYVGAGTVEFIAEPDGRFYFMEMNTRLQVEHPVTEMITGLDLVEWQLRVANGERLPLLQAELPINGHSIEVRIYAENPDKGFLPSTGVLHHLRTPVHGSFTVGANSAGEPAAVRIDSGVSEGDTITPFYDPMIAKLIVWGHDRNAARARMSQALTAVEVVGVSTNIGFLKRLMQCASFSSADLDTGLIERERAALLNIEQAVNADWIATAVAYLLQRESAAASHSTDPWSTTNGWRANGMLTRQIEFIVQEETVRALVDYGRAGYTVHAQGKAVCLGGLSLKGNQLRGLIGSQALDASVVARQDQLVIFANGEERTLKLAPTFVADTASQTAGSLRAPMPGKVITLHVSAGATVKRGQALLVMEAMKMEHTIHAPADGIVSALLYQAGEQVAEDAQLIEFEASK